MQTKKGFKQGVQWVLVVNFFDFFFFFFFFCFVGDLVHDMDTIYMAYDYCL